MLKPFPDKETSVLATLAISLATVTWGCNISMGSTRTGIFRIKPGSFECQSTKRNCLFHELSML